MERKDETIVALYQLLGQIFYTAAQADKTWQMYPPGDTI